MIRLGRGVTLAAWGAMAVVATAQNGHLMMATEYRVGLECSDIASGDVDEDGFSDLVAACAGSDAVFLLLGQPDARFADPVPVPAGVRPIDVDVIDLDGDGHLDFVTANEGDGTIGISLGDGAGNFAAQLPLVPGGTLSDLLMVDLDGDLDLDAVVTDSDTDRVVVFEHLGGGTFAAPLVFSVGLDPIDVVAADLDGSGVLDLVTANVSDAGVSVLLSSGSGLAYQAPTVVGITSARPAAVGAGDIDGDGDADVFAASRSGESLSVLSNDGTGALSETFLTPVDADTSALLVHDLNGDTNIDVIALSDELDTMSLLFGRGDGTFDPAVSQFAKHRPANAVLDDFDLDGRLDLAFANYHKDGGDGPSHVSLALGVGDGTFEVPDLYDVGKNCRVATLGDFDLDGEVDVCIGNAVGQSAVIMFSNGDGTFTVGPPQPIEGAANSIDSADFNLDGFMDVCTANRNRNSSTVLLGNGDGTWKYRQDVWAGTNPRGSQFFDVDEDGLPDLVMSNKDSNNVSIHLNLGDGTFGPGSFYGQGTWPLLAIVEDIDNDGHGDLLACNWTSDDMTVRFGNGDGTFGQKVTYGGIISPSRLFLHDFDQDGDKDAAFATLEGFALTILPSNGDGTFETTPLTWDVGGESRYMAIADFDGDGLDDILYPNEGYTKGGPSRLTYFRNLGNLDFEEVAHFATDSKPYDVVLEDFDHDGDLDAVVPNYIGSRVTVFRNILGPWKDLRRGMTGSAGDPLLVGIGQMEAGETTGYRLSRALPSSLASFVVGFTELGVPFKGGVLVPTPDVLLSGFVTDGDGALDLVAPWPSGVFSDVDLYAQFWISDPAGPKGLVGSNAVLGVTP